MSLVWKEFDLPCTNTSILSLFALPAPLLATGETSDKQRSKKPCKVFEEFFWVSRWPNLTVYMCWHLKNSLWLWFFLFLRESTGEFCLFRHILLPSTPTHTHTPSRAQFATQKVFWKQLPLAHTWILLALCRPQGARSYLLFFLTQRGAPHPHSHTHIHKSVSLGYIHFLKYFKLRFLSLCTHIYRPWEYALRAKMGNY